ncbi:MAG: mannose-1-phosphate guanylyltransferase [Bacteroidota bacterium]
MKMKDPNTYSLIMAGGIGSRFWPMSTPQKPKQFLDVLGIGKSLLQLTFERMLAFSEVQNIYILTNEEYLELVLEQLPGIKAAQVICEPQRKNTAPCIAFAAAKINSINANATLVISPSDHLILNAEKFNQCILRAIDTAAMDQLVTLGIQPTRPDTGYGYIEIANKSTGQVHPVLRFREKPDVETAKAFVTSGNYFWNAGIFIWKASTVLSAFESHAMNLHRLFCHDLTKYNGPHEQAFMRESFAACEDISIDFAVMEHASNVSVVLSDFDWSDLGTWGSLTDHLNKDDHGNAVVGEQVHMFEAENCLVHMPKGKVALLDGLKDYIVVDADGMLLILRKDHEQELKRYLKVLETAKPVQHSHG